MTINPSAISTASQGNQYVLLPMLDTPPDLGEIIDPPLAPGSMWGVYNGSTDMVELYIVDANGTRYIRVSAPTVA